MLDILENKKPFEVIKMEVRINRRQKINQILKKIGKEVEPTFANIFNQDTAKKVLLHYINEIEEAYPPLLTYQYDSPKKFFIGFLVANPKIKLTPALKMLGLRVLLNEMGVREFREMAKRYGNSAWYGLNKEMKKLNGANEVSVFSMLRKQLAEFKPMKLLDFQNRLLNNVKYG